MMHDWIQFFFSRQCVLLHIKLMIDDLNKYLYRTIQTEDVSPLIGAMIDGWLCGLFCVMVSMSV